MKKDLSAKWFIVGCTFLFATILLLGYAFLNSPLHPSQLMIIHWAMSISAGFSAGFFIGNMKATSKTPLSRFAVTATSGFAVWLITFFGQPMFFEKFNIEARTSFNKEIVDETLLNRIYETRINNMIITSKFGFAQPHEISLSILGNDMPAIQLFFDYEGTLVRVQGYDPWKCLLPSSMTREMKNSNIFFYGLNFNDLRKIDPTNILNNLTLKHLDNAIVYLHVSSKLIGRLPEYSDKSSLFLGILAEISGYSIEILDKSISKAELFKSLPEDMQQTNEFLVVGTLGWKIEIKSPRVVKSKETFNMTPNDLDKTRRFYRGEEYEKYWDGIWYKKEYLEYFSSKYGVPSSKGSVIFHPQNFSFTQIPRNLRDVNREVFNCELLGISSFNNINTGYYHLFATMITKYSNYDPYVHKQEGNEIKLSEDQIKMIFPLCAQISALNAAYGDKSGIIEAFFILFPSQKKYVLLNPEHFDSYLKRQSINNIADFDDLENYMWKSVVHSIVKIADLPI